MRPYAQPALHPDFDHQYKYDGVSMRPYAQPALNPTATIYNSIDPAESQCALTRNHL